MPPQIGKLLILVGIVIAVVGVILVFFDRIPLIGKLPGDIQIRKKGLVIYIPIATSILISIILSLVLWLLRRGR
jgi:hypothetical protein